MEPRPVKVGMPGKLTLGAGPVDDAQAPAMFLDPRLARRDEDERQRATSLFESSAQSRSPVVVQVPPGRRLEDDRQPVARLGGERLWQQLDEIALHELRRVAAKSLDRPVEPREPVVLAGPDEAAQQTGAFVARDVDRRAVDSDAATNERGELEELTRNRPALLSFEQKRRGRRAPFTRLVPIPVAVPRQVQARARAELDEVETTGSR